VVKSKLEQNLVLTQLAVNALAAQEYTTRNRAHYVKTCRHSQKPEVHNASQRRRGITEPQPQLICIENLV